MEFMDRLNTYNKDHCWQYDIRLNNLKDDLKVCGITKKKAAGLKVSDFTFKNVTNTNEFINIKEFIERHEWLGTMPQYITHRFACYYNDTLAGVILFSMPNAFSKLIGDDTKKYERLISRGACISWSPKNLASSFMMWCIKWMVENTQYRIFTAYSDPTARELGTIYQACNFYYLGQQSGTTERCINPYTGKMVSNRFFRCRSAYKKYAKELGIVWKKNWNADQKMLWENIPTHIAEKLKSMSKVKYKESKKISFPSKHKYAIVLGVDRRETKKLRKLFESRNKVHPYPKERGV